MCLYIGPQELGFTLALFTFGWTSIRDVLYAPYILIPPLNASQANVLGLRLGGIAIYIIVPPLIYGWRCLYSIGFTKIHGSIVQGF